jgi:hypothetical protein
MTRTTRLVVMLFPFMAVLAASALPAIQTADDPTVYVTKTGAKYHREACTSLRRSSVPMKLSSAALRYGACKVCSPPTLAGPPKTTDPDLMRLKEPAKKTSTATAARCQATTRKGTQCSRRAQSGRDYCWQHP